MLNRAVRWTLGMGVACSVMLSAELAHAQQKIAIVDIRRAIEETTEGKASIGGLKAEADRKQKSCYRSRMSLRSSRKTFSSNSRFFNQPLPRRSGKSFSRR